MILIGSIRQALAPALESGAISTRLLPLLVNQQLFGSLHYTPLALSNKPSLSAGVPLEFVNYFFALLVLSIVWPNTFWRANKAFSLIFTFHLG